MNCQSCFLRPTCRHYGMLVLDLIEVPVKEPNHEQGLAVMKAGVFAAVAQGCAYYHHADFLPFDNSKEEKK
jgi:hypothetical protein